MPFTINGFGTGYRGRRNISQRQDTCESCHHFGGLTSYDTRNYFLAVFLPIIPLGGLRVIDECPRCHRHRVMPLNAWTKAKAETVGQTAAAQQQSPHDPVIARQALEAATAFDDQDALLQAAMLVERHHPNHAAVQAALGNSFRHFSLLDDAIAAFQDSLVAADDPEVRETLAFTLAQLGRGEEAMPHIEHIINRQRRERVGVVYAVIEALQTKGLHNQSLDLLHRIGQAFPELERDKGHRKYVKISSKNAATGKPIKGSLQAAGKLKPARESRFGWMTAAIVGPAILLLALGIYLLVAVQQGRSRAVHVVNGTSAPYTVDLNGQQLIVPGKGRRTMQVAEGEIIVKVTGTPLPMPEQRVVISTPFLTRPFSHPTFVINPDQTAVVLWEQTRYATNPSMLSGEDPWKTHAGRAMYEFSGIDYEFREFPAEVDMPRKASIVRRERVTQLPDLHPFEVYDMIRTEQNEAAASDYLRTAARFAPDDEDLMDVVSTVMEPDDVIALVTPGLAHRPLLVEWHRAYQIAREAKDERQTLQPEYEALHQAAPGDPGLLYLHARMLDDDAAQERLFLQAIDLGLASPHAAHWLCYCTMSSGRFEEAIEMSRRLVQFNPVNAHYRMHEVEALLASGDVAAALAANTRSISLDALNPPLLYEQMMLLHLAGRPDDAQGVISQYIQILHADDLPPEDIAAWQVWLDAMLAYLRGDGEAFGKAVENVDSPWRKSQAKVCLGRVSDALADLKQAEDADVHDWMIMEVAALDAGEEAAAAEARAKVDDLLREITERRYKAMAGLLSSAAPDRRQVLDLRISTEFKRTVLVLTGLRHPSLRDDCFALARKLNFDIRFPYLLYRDVLDGK